METTILLIDDDVRILETFSRALKLAGCAVLTAEDGEKGLAVYRQEQPDLIMLDLRMPGMDGIDVLRAIRQHDPEANVILTTGHGDRDAVIEALRAGASDVLSKPIDQVALESALRRAEERIELKRKLRASEEALRKQNEQLEETVQARTTELQETLAKYQVLFDAFPLGISVSDVTGRILEANQESERLLGLSQEEQAEREIDGAEWGIIRPDGSPMPAEEYASVQALQQGQLVENVEMGIVKPDGDVTWINVTAAPLMDDRVVIAYNDITKRKLAEDALRESEGRLSAILRHTPVIIYLKDTQGRFTLVNHAFEQAFDVSQTDIIGKTSYDLVLEARAAEHQAHDEQVIQTGRPLEFEETAIEADGQQHTVISVKFPMYDAEGTLYGVGGISADITERKRIEEDLRKSEERFRTLVDVLPQFVAYTDKDLIYRFVNQTYQDKFDIRPEDIVGRSLPDVIGDVAFEEARSHVERALQGERVRYHERFDYAIGGTRDIDGILVPDVTKDGQVRGYYAVLTDITPYIETQEALRRTTERLRILREIDAAILDAQSPEEIARSTLERLNNLIPCQRTSITEIDAARQRGRDLIVLIDGENQLDKIDWHPLPNAGPLIDTIQGGRTHYVEDIAVLETKSLLEERLEASGIRSYVSVPLLVQDIPQGTLNLGSERPAFFQPNHVEILEEIAASLAVALQQARLLEQTQKDAEAKAVLLREVNHRVLNNLTAIIGILDMEQRRSLDDKADLRAVLEDVSHRIGGMTTVHRMLSSAQWQPLDVKEVVERVIYAALSSSPIRPQIAVTVDAPEEPLRMPSKQAISMALVINELTTNSVKYAFRDRPQGRIDVRITLLDEETVRVTFRDDGPGMSDDVLAGKQRDVGLRLVEANVRHTLGGEIDYHNDDGGVVTFTLDRAPLN